MIEFTKITKKDDLIDSLMDLKHDLGKYIFMPFAMLPRNASNCEILHAIETSLFKTRKCKNGVRPAKDIWLSFLSEAQEKAQEFDGFDQLKTAVNKALGWENIINDNLHVANLDQVKKDMSMVSSSIQLLIEEVSCAL